MWRLFFEVCDFMVGFIPSKEKRERIRREKLYDYRKKYNALRKIIPEHEFKKVRVIKGGWNIGFIINKKYVCKIRKFLDANVPNEKIIREKRITDAFANILPVQIPKIDILRFGNMTFYKYNFIIFITRYSHILSIRLKYKIYSIICTRNLFKSV